MNKLVEKECKEALEYLGNQVVDKLSDGYTEPRIVKDFEYGSYTLLEQLIGEHFELVKAYEELEQSSYQLECNYNDLKEKAKALSDFNDELMRKLFFIEPYKFEDLKENMWVWSKSRNSMCIILSLNNQSQRVVFEDFYYSDTFISYYNECDFYPVQMANEVENNE